MAPPLLAAKTSVPCKPLAALADALFAVVALVVVLVCVVWLVVAAAALVATAVAVGCFTGAALTLAEIGRVLMALLSLTNWAATQPSCCAEKLICTQVFAPLRASAV